MKKILLFGGFALLPLILYYGYIVFDIATEKGPEFPRQPIGLFIQEPSIQNQLLSWSIPELCQINEGEFQNEGAEKEDGWFGLTADCVRAEEGVVCHADLSDRELEKEVTYLLQVYHAGCESNARYSSHVITFSLNK